MQQDSRDDAKADWVVFQSADQDRNVVIVMSRLGSPAIREFAIRSRMTRLRCLLSPDMLNHKMMPNSTAALDDYEDEILADLEASDANAILVAVVTGTGCRDLFFASEETGVMVNTVERLKHDRPFRLQVGFVNGSSGVLVDSLTA